MPRSVLVTDVDARIVHVNGPSRESDVVEALAQLLVNAWRRQKDEPPVVEPEQKPATISLVYLFQCGFAFKVGVASGATVKDALSARLANIRRDLARRDVQLIGTITCDSRPEAFKLERTLHKEFRGLRVRGEWFRANDAILNRFQSHEGFRAS